ncbi:MAG: SAM-dependent chlorinase/fluorinase, partial [Phycisphaeraceae bacterium]
RATVDLAVVDPGVGTDRAILAASVAGHLFVAPDNGLLTDVLAAADPAPVVVKVTGSEHFLPRVSQTFHGRDIFAPVAAALANGLPLEQLGDVTNAWVTLNRREPRVTPHRVAGEVVHIDQFGNLITNIQTHHLPASDRVTVHLRNQQVQGIASSYADAGQGTLMAIIGSTDRLEISIALGSAADELGVSVGETVWLEKA